MKKVLAGFSAAAILLTQVSSVFAAYSDVPAGVWYEDAVKAFTDAGYLDAAQPKFRGTDTANRAEFTKLVVELNGGILSTPPAVPSFDDVKASAWYYGYMEEAGKEGWVKGDGNCYGTHPCYARPSSNISRAEAAALIVRAFGLESTGAASQFVDNPSGQWYTEAIQIAADHCVLQGDATTGRVRPTDNMNRAEMVVMLNRVDQGLTYGKDCGTTGPSASVPSISSAAAVSTTKVDVTFNVALDKATAETMANYALSPAATVSDAKLVSEKVVELTVDTALTSGKEYTLTASNMKTADGKVFSDSAKFTGYSALPQGNGTLEVSASSKNPTGDTVPKGAHGVTMLSLDLTASCDDSVTIESITALHEGFGDKSDITGVYATIDGGRVSRERSIDSSDQTVVIRFITPLVVPACKTTTVDIQADISSTADTSAEHNMAMELASDFTSNAKSVTGNFPIRGNTFKVASVTSGEMSVTYRTVSPNQLEVGDKDKVIGRFEVSTNSTEDQTLYTMTIHQNGSVSDGDITNIKIRRTDGTVLTNVAEQFKNKFATLTFNPPFTVLEGDRITLEVVGDIVGGAAKTIQTDFDETSDIFAVGSLYGYGVNGQLYGSSITTSGDATSITLDAGQFTVEINGPAQQTYTRDQNDALLANVVFTTGGETVNIKKMFVAVRGQTVTGATLATGHYGTAYDAITEVLENVRIKNAATGTSIEGTAKTGTNDYGATAGQGTYQVYEFDDFTVNGKETWQILVDFIDNGTGNHPLNGDQFKAHICGEPSQISNAANATGCNFDSLYTSTSDATSKSWQMVVEGLSTGDKVQDVRPRGTISGNAQRIADSSLTVSVNALSSTETAVKNAKNVRLMRFEARAGEAKNILLTKLIFESAAGSATLKNGTNYALWVDTDGNGIVDTILDKNKSAAGSSDSALTTTFDTLTNGGFVINKEQTVTFEVHGDIAGALQSTTSLQLRFATGSTFIEAETVDRGTNLAGIKVNGSYILSVTSADMVVTTATTPLFSLVSQGSLFVTKDSTPVRAHQLLAGELGDAVLRLNMRAVNEPIDVTNLTLSSSGGYATSVDRLELYKEGATTYFAVATANGCGTDDVPSFNPTESGQLAAFTQVTNFCAKMQSQQLVVPKGGEVKVLVRPKLKNDEAGATSKQVIALFIDKNNAMSNSSGTGSIRARGVDSSNNLSGNDNDVNDDGEVFIGTSVASTAGNSYIASTKNVSVLAKVGSIVNASPDANGTILTATTRPLGQFKIATLANTNTKNGLNKFALSGVIFNVTATNMYLDSTAFVFFNNASNTTQVGCSTISSSDGSAVTSSRLSGSFLVSCDMQAGTYNTLIGSDSNSTFTLQGTISNSKVASTNSSLVVSLQNFTDIAKSTLAYNTSHMSWEDMDDTGSAGRFFWTEYPDTIVNSTSYAG